MGFFSNLKNAVTGGAASVQIQLPPAARRGETIPVTIQATAKSAAKVTSVYLLVRATEHAQVKDTDYANGKSSTETVHGRKITYETRIAIAGAQQLDEGQSYTWQGQLPMPQTSNPTFRGQMINHTWEIQAGLDMTGNDPDSGWQTIEVS
jgi:hypothetical protein